MKKTLSLILALMMTVLTVNVFAENSYTSSDWAKEELKKAEEMDLIPETLLSEDLKKDITRQEFAAVSVKLYEKLSGEKAEEVKDNPFTDTTDSYVLKAYNLGVTTGTSENTFSPGNLLNREQAATMLTRVFTTVTDEEIVAAGPHPSQGRLYFVAKEEVESGKQYKAITPFEDDEHISDWAKDSVYFMAVNDVIKGVGENKFAPKNVTEEESDSGYANASREQAIIMAARMTELEIPKREEEKNDKEQIDDIDPYKDAERQDPTKEIGDNTYTVAFIGGSLTEGGSSWIATTKKMLEEKMPDKEIVTINAGKGGTGSAYGAARFMEDVGKYAPDMVFIEFAVNDCGQSEEGHKMYMESMVRQAKKLSKEPVIIFLHAPHPVEKDSDTYKKCQASVMYKTQVGNHYGIKSIDIYDYMQRDYAKIKDEKGYKTFTDYLATMYSKSGSGFDVHGGYAKYGEAIVEAFTNDYEACMAKPKSANVYYVAKKKIVEASYNHIFIDSGRMNFTGPWETYTADNQFTTSDAKATINAKDYKYPFFPAGIKQVMNNEAAFGFDTKAEAFCLNYIASTAGSKVKVYVDKKEVGTLSCYSPYHSMNYTTNWVELPNDGKTHRVIMVVETPTVDNYVFRFGSVIERIAK